VLFQPAEIRKKDDIIAVMKVAANCADHLKMAQKSTRSPAHDADQNSAQHEVEKYFQRYPQMSCGGDTEVFLRKWLSSMFVGDQEVCKIICGELIDVASRRPHHLYLNSGEYAVVQLPAFHGNGFDEESLAVFCFEVFNVENCKGFRKIHESAMQGMISEDEYVMQTLKLEHTAILNVRKFYLEEILPKMQLDGIESDPSKWSANFPLSLTYFISALKGGKSGATWDHYAKHYRRLYFRGYWRGGLPGELSPVVPLVADKACP